MAVLAVVNRPTVFIVFHFRFPSVAFANVHNSYFLLEASKDMLEYNEQLILTGSQESSCYCNCKCPVVTTKLSASMKHASCDQ